MVLKMVSLSTWWSALAVNLSPQTLIIISNLFAFSASLVIARVFFAVSKRSAGEGAQKIAATNGPSRVDDTSSYEHDHWLREDRAQRANQYGDVDDNCNGPLGLLVGDASGGALSSTAPDCDRLCGASVRGSYVLVETGRDTLINGSSTVARGYYCLRPGVSVIECNRVTADVVRAADGEWSCAPRWPNVFGGRDGNDILVCGGRVDDEGVSYMNRLTGLAAMVPLSGDPYTEPSASGDGPRFRCTPGLYTGGPTDATANEYIETPGNRFYRMRNGCARYVVGALASIAPEPDREGFCRCIRDRHGPLRRYDDVVRWYGDEPVTVEDGSSAALPIGYASVPHACSPCVNRVDMRDGGVVNAPRGCVKSNTVYVTAKRANTRTVDTIPCGVNSFDDASAPACTDARLLVSLRQRSYYVQRIIDELTD